MVNVFATDIDPVIAAYNLDDKRVVKMCVETAQLLSQALIANGSSATGIYASNHAKHPSALWAGSTRANFMWLVTHGLALCDCYTNVYYKRHKSRDVIEQCRLNASDIPDGPITTFAIAADRVQYSMLDRSEPVECYRHYMRIKWYNDKRKPTWRNRGCPYWADDLFGTKV